MESILKISIMFFTFEEKHKIFMKLLMMAKYYIFYFIILANLLLNKVFGLLKQKLKI